MNAHPTSRRHQPRSADEQVVGYVKASHIIDGLIDALISALRTGVPVTQLPDHAMFNTERVHVSYDLRKQQLDSLHLELQEALSLKDAARDRAKAAQRRDDSEAADEYDADASVHRAAAKRHQSAIDALREDPHTPAKPTPFDVRADVWVPTLKSIKASGGQLNQDEISALNLILPELRVEPVGHRWQGVATLRITTSQGVAELGPIRWDIDSAARGAQVVALLRGRPIDTGETRRKPEIVADLVHTNKIGRAAALVAVNAPFPELRAVLLHTLCDEPWPAWVDDQWRSPTFAHWIRDVYTNPAWNWMSNGRYTRLSAHRQLAVHTAATEGTCSGGQISERIGTARTDVTRYAHDVTFKSMRPWRRSLTLLESARPARNSILGPITCVCGNAATIVARAPEVVTDLLCDCGRMPAGEKFGAPADLRFPDAYRDLRLSEKHCIAELGRATAKQATSLPPRSRKVLELLAVEDGQNEGELRQASGLVGLNRALARLHTQGFIEPRQGATRRWHLTSAGRAKTFTFDR